MEAEDIDGTAQVFQASLASTPLLVLAALLAVYIVLGMLYESLIHPITILSTLPSAGVGAASLARLVVKPMRRPAKITLIQMTSDKTATALPAGGAAVALSQR